MEAIVTGSRIAYLGKQYYTEVVFNVTLAKAHIDFNQSRFRIQVNPTLNSQVVIRQELDAFFRRKAHEKITPRVNQ